MASSRHDRRRVGCAVEGKRARFELAWLVATGTLLTVSCASGDAGKSTESSHVATTTSPANTVVATTTEPTTSAPTTTKPTEPGLWVDGTLAAIGVTGLWTNKVDLEDIDLDGDVDILFADGGEYDAPGDPVVNQIFVNDGKGVFTDVSEQVLGDVGDLARVIKARDLNGDAVPDIFIGTTFDTQSRLFLGQGGLNFIEVTDTNLPQLPASVGDVEVGDVDDDGDLDLVLADWGPGNPMQNEGGPVRVWLNDGAATFTEAGADQVPALAVEFSWDLELVDVDNDFDLDIVVSCKRCEGGFLYRNDGTGVFTDASDSLPDGTNNYEFEAIDLDGDGFLDLTTINDGFGALKERILLADGTGGFVDATEQLWPQEANIGMDDNVAVFADIDSDGDADILIGSLDGPDRVLVNDGTGHLTLIRGVFGDTGSSGTLGLAVADLDGDARLDVVMAQGEVAIDEKVFFADQIAPDTAPPVIGIPVLADGVIRVRVNDNKSPTVPHDWQSVEVEGPGASTALRWYGEYLWRASVDLPGEYRVCATDAAGNTTCSENVSG